MSTEPDSGWLTGGVQDAETGALTVPAGIHGGVRVLPGPRLLAGASAWPSLEQHRGVWPAPRPLTAARLAESLGHCAVRGRGGAGFPFSRKLAAALTSGRRRHVVVNGAEGEPASAKDSVLLTTAPHLVLDGAELVAHALGTRTIHLVLPGERPGVDAVVETAVRERGRVFSYRVHRTTGGFVGGQARAVIELIEGRANLPVTAWAPEAVSGIKGRPTLLSNAETYAQVGAALALGPAGYGRLGTAEEPGTTLLTLAGDGPGATVLEVEHGTGLDDVLALVGVDPGPVLAGGYHGAWLPTREVLRRSVLAADLRDAGAALGAGVLLPLAPGRCPVEVTAAIVTYLAGQSAGRCGPCRNGLPALARATSLLATGGVVSATRRIEEVTGLVTGRGACAHPDGTSRLVRSLLAAFPQEVRAHENARCLVADGGQLG